MDSFAPIYATVEELLIFWFDDTERDLVAEAHNFNVFVSAFGSIFRWFQLNGVLLIVGSKMLGQIYFLLKDRRVFAIRRDHKEDELDNLRFWNAILEVVCALHVAFIIKLHLLDIRGVHRSLDTFGIQRRKILTSATLDLNTHIEGQF